MFTWTHGTFPFKNIVGADVPSDHSLVTSALKKRDCCYQKKDKTYDENV